MAIFDIKKRELPAVILKCQKVVVGQTFFWQKLKPFSYDHAILIIDRKTFS
jgi:hypothetical protein